MPEVVIATGNAVVSTLAGGAVAGSADGLGVLATFNNPVNVVALSTGEIIVADFGNGSLREIATDGSVATLFPSGTFAQPFGLAVSETDELYLETDGNVAGTVTRETGTIWSIDLVSLTATAIIEDIGRPRGLAVLADGSLVLSDPAHHTLRRLDPVTSILSPLAGLEDVPGCDDGTGATARFNQPYGVAVDASGDVLVADQLSHRIRRVTLAGAVSTYAGEAARGMVDGPAATARFDMPQYLAIDPLGNVYVSDLENHRIRRIDASGVVTSLAGSGTEGFADGQHDLAMFFGMEGMTLDGTSLILADGNRGNAAFDYHRIRAISLP